MILVDTSVWIEFLNKKEPYKNYLLYLLQHGEVATVEPIFGELLQGASGSKETQLLVNYFYNLPKPEFEEPFIQAGINSSKSRWFAKGLGLIDSVVLSAAMAKQIPLWTLDKNLKSLLPKALIHEPNLV